MIILKDSQAQSKQFTTHPMELLKLDWRGGDSLAAGKFVQIWDCELGPTDPNAILLKTYPIYTGAFDAKDFRPDDNLNFTLGCFVGISSTEMTYTATSGNDKYAYLSLEFIRSEVPSDSTFVGDLTTGVTGLQVWTEATGLATPKKLVALEVDGTNLSGGGIQFIQIFAKDTVNTGNRPMESIPIASGGTALVSGGVSFKSVMTGKDALRFAPRGLDVIQADAPTPTITYHYGCTVKISSTASTFTACTGTATIRAEYNTSNI